MSIWYSLLASFTAGGSKSGRFSMSNWIRGVSRDLDKKTSAKGSVVMELIKLISMDWNSLSTTQLDQARRPFYDQCLELMNGVSTAKDPRSVGGIWALLENIGLDPWAFVVHKQMFKCTTCGAMELSPHGPSNIGLIQPTKGQEEKQSLSIQALVHKWFIPQRLSSSASLSEYGGSKCPRCRGTNGFPVRLVRKTGLLPEVLIISLGNNARLVGPSTPSKVPITYINTKNRAQLATYQWQLSICGGRDGEVDRYRVYHSKCDTINTVRYDPYGSEDGRFIDVR